MKFDNAESAAVAHANSHVRLDIYRDIHKALRMSMGHTLQQVGSVDWQDDACVAKACEQVQRLADFCERHLAHENTHIHAVMEARAPGSSDKIAAEHIEHELEIAALRNLANQLTAAQTAQRESAVHALYQTLALFIAHNMVHMHVEETQNNAVLWSSYTDAEILGIEQRLVAHIAPPMMMLTMRWMIPGMSHPDRVAMFSGIKAGAPQPVFDALLNLARESLNDAEWTKLARAMQQPVAPGLVAK